MPSEPTTLPRFRELAASEGLVDLFPAAVQAETQAWLEAPQIDDPALTDWTGIPFVTVDGPFTRDLDQALHVERVGAGFRLRYAIADASFYVAPGSALLAEALRRGSSYYFPGFSVPMLPRDLSEGLVSLNEGVDRRALVFDVRLGADASIASFELVRARVRSQKKLTFGEVEAFLASGADPAAGHPSPLTGTAFADSLRGFVDLGRARAVHPDRQKMVHYRRNEAEVSLDGAGQLVVSRGPRAAAELATEEISILANALGARLLASGDAESVQPIYKVHAPPDPLLVQGFERLVAAVARSRGLPDDPWLYRRAAASGIAGYLELLPTEGEAGRLARALHRQAMLLNGRSVFAAEPHAHFGVGEAQYSRFTAPMREVVGVFCHKEALERIGARRSRPRAEDEAIRLTIIDAANQAKSIQKKIDRAVDRAVVEALLAPDAALSESARPLRRGTVMGIAGSKVHVALDDPPVDVVAPFRLLAELRGGAWLSAEADGERLVVKETGAVVCRLGDAISVRAASSHDVLIVPEAP